MAIVYSHVRSELRPSKRARARQARSSASCRASSASSTRAEHAIAVGVEQAAVRLDQPGEGVLVAPRGRRRAARARSRRAPSAQAAPSAARRRSRRPRASPPRCAIRSAPRAARAAPGAEPAGAIGDLVDPVDLDVGQPHRAARRALDDAAAEGAAQRQRVVAGAPGVDPLRCASAAAPRRTRSRPRGRRCAARGGRRDAGSSRPPRHRAAGRSRSRVSSVTTGGSSQRSPIASWKRANASTSVSGLRPSSVSVLETWTKLTPSSSRKVA